ncbi:hypothetical protein OCO_19470 [Mycobacterium intracellulare MOTT-02]|nr:hypothetical protein OCO_19470 [Mycobacterium intracellulare MOTT-02]
MIDGWRHIAYVPSEVSRRIERTTDGALVQAISKSQDAPGR